MEIGLEQDNPDNHQQGKTKEMIEEIMIGLYQDQSLGLDPIIE